MTIQDVKEIIRACRYCFMCRYACPTFIMTKRESVTPRGYALLMMTAEKENQHWSDDMKSAIYQCSLCGLGVERCEFKWQEDDMVRQARQMIVSSGQAPENVKNSAEIFLADDKSWDQKLSLPMDEKNVEVLYLAGCQTRANNPEIISATTKIFNTAGIKWTVLGDEGCCGGGLYDLGYVTEARQKALEQTDRINGISPKIIVTGCAHCYRTLKEFYPAWGIERFGNHQVLHMSEYLIQLITENRIELKHSSKAETYAYHDPCMLGRKMGVYDAPRNVIEKIMGSAPLELFHNREVAECCGAGSVTYLTEREIALNVAQGRLRRVKEVNPSMLVTACQNCKNILTDANDNPNLKVADLVEIVAGRLK